MDQSKPPLHASQEKIKRADSKFDYLETAINAYISSRPYSQRAEVKNERVYVIAHRDKDIPDDVAFEVVEAVGHLRSALDKMVVALVVKEGRGTSGVWFPFGGLDSNGKPKPFPDARLDGLKKKLTTDQWHFIEAQKPYPGGNDALWSINQVANADKHWENLVEIFPEFDRTVSIPTMGTVYMTNIRLNWNTAEHQSVLADKERERVLVSLDALGINPQVHLQVTPRVVFGEVPPVTRKDVLPTLSQQIDLVKQILAACKSGFFN